MKNLIISLFITVTSYSQTISKQVNGVSGEIQNASTVQLSWTIGEPVVGLMTAENIQLGNGYYQAMDIQKLSVQESSKNFGIKVYPNPTSKFLYFFLPEFNLFSVQIVDMNAKLLYEGTINKDQSLDISNYLEGIYFITVVNKETNEKYTFKILKK